jgi:hypothetical protein
MAKREAELLPVPYFHLVFSLPAQIADIAYQNKAVIYDLLFKASSEAADWLAFGLEDVFAENPEFARGGAAARSRIGCRSNGPRQAPAPVRPPRPDPSSADLEQAQQSGAQQNVERGGARNRRLRVQRS